MSSKHTRFSNYCEMQFSTSNRRLQRRFDYRWLANDITCLNLFKKTVFFLTKNLGILKKPLQVCW